MAYKYFNNNPCGKTVGDCVVRAISCCLDIPWDEAYMAVCNEGLKMCDMPSSNSVWSTFLMKNGFTRNPISKYRVKDFARDYPNGVYILSTGTHVVCVKFGDYMDAWDSGNELIENVFTKER